MRSTCLIFLLFFSFIFSQLSLAVQDPDNDGVSDSRDKCPDTPRGVKSDKDGCP